MVNATKTALIKECVSTQPDRSVLMVFALWGVKIIINPVDQVSAAYLLVLPRVFVGGIVIENVLRLNPPVE